MFMEDGLTIRWCRLGGEWKAGWFASVEEFLKKEFGLVLGRKLAPLPDGSREEYPDM